MRNCLELLLSIILILIILLWTWGNASGSDKSQEL